MVVPDTIPGVAITIGCLVAGRIYISLDPEQPADRLAATLRDAAPAATIMPTDMASVLTGQTAALPTRDSDPDAPAAVHYISGSTGRPKGIVTTLYATLRQAQFAMEAWQLGPGDRLQARMNVDVERTRRAV